MANPDLPAALPPPVPMAPLAESALLRLLLSSEQAIYCTVDAAGVVLATGGGGSAGLVLPSGGAACRLSELFSEAPQVEAQLARALAGERVQAGRWRHHGRVFEVQLGPLQAPTGGPIAGAVLYAHDVTQWEQAEATAKWNEMILSHAAKGAPVVIAVYDTQGVYVSQIGHGLKRLGLVPNQLKGQSVFKVFAGATESLRLVEEALQGKEHSNTQDIGSSVWDNWISPIRDAQQKIVGVMSISTDVTERERAQSALREQLHQLEEQSHALREMAAPIIQIWKGVLVVPVVGQLTSERVGIITAALLEAIVQTRAQAAILDLTAVAQVDTATADHLVRIIRSVSLLGARGLISGIAPAVAQTIVSMGIDLSQITTVASLHEALRLFINAKNS